MNLQEQVRAIREAGHVRRCHTLPHVGHYDVANHSWQALALLHALHPNPSRELIWALAFHDVAERFTGDVPAPAKWGSPELVTALRELEFRIDRALGIRFELTEEDSRWLDAIDRLELLLWAEDQLAMGNKNAEQCGNLIRLWFRKRWESLPLPVAQFISGYTWSRSNEQLP